MKLKKSSIQIKYSDMFWLFMIGSLLGVILEGFWCLFKYGHWETHVVSVWGPFCIIYGIGAVGFYLGTVWLRQRTLPVQFLLFSLIGGIVEYVCSWVLEHGLHMEAWNYSRHFLNIEGRISLKMTLVWGLLGIVFSRFLFDAVNKLFEKMRGKAWRIACGCLTVFMVINLTLTGMCLVRWSDRHEGIPPANQIERFLDKTYGDDRMEKRFCEWSFIDKASQ